MALKPVVIKRAKGGLTKAADMVRQEGRYGDDMLVHMNPREFALFQKQFGPGTVNPSTGLPEFFLGDLVSGVGNLFGGADWGSSLLNAGIGAGLGYLTGGNAKSALIGGALGGLSPLILGGGGVSGLLGLGDGFGAPLVSDAAKAATDGSIARPGDLGSGGSGGGGILGSLLGGSGGSGGGALGKALPLLALASAFSGSKKQKPPTDYTSQQFANSRQMNARLQNVDFNRTRTPMTGFDPTNYGYGAGRQFYENNALPPVRVARGGMPVPAGALAKAPPSRYVEGPGTGRSDEVPARLSKGEFVVDAETVALLGDGSSEAGAKRLDEMRKGVRQHKGKALAKGNFSPNAKHPMAYIGKGAK